MGEFHTFMQIMQEKALFSGKIYIAGKDFARPPVMTFATSVWYDLWCNGHPRIQTLPKLAKIKLPEISKIPKLHKSCYISGSQTIFSRTQVQLLFCIFKNLVLCGVYTLGVVEIWMLWPWRLRMPTLRLIVMFDRGFEVEVWLWFSSWSWVGRSTDFEAAWSKYRWWWITTGDV